MLRQCFQYNLKHSSVLNTLTLQMGKIKAIYLIVGMVCLLRNEARVVNKLGPLSTRLSEAKHNAIS